MISRIDSQPAGNSLPSYALSRSSRIRSVPGLIALQKTITPRPFRNAQSFSLLRALSFASLLVSVRSQLFPAQLELSSLDGMNGFALNGENASDQSGWSVSSAGDVNGDGVSDLLIGARYADPPGRTNAGKTYVVFGKVGLGAGGTVELSNLKGTTGFTLNGEQSNDRSGWSVSNAGDVNGDGVSDLLIGARYADPLGRTDAGKTYVVFGRVGLGTGGAVELSNLDGTAGFALNGERSGDYSGYSVCSAGDVNGDGVSDILIGARYADPTSSRTDAGKTYVVFGKVGLGAGGAVELSNLDGTAGFTLNGEQSGDLSGYSVCTAGDVNGDGIADFLIGARYADHAGRTNAGKTYVVFGKVGLGAGGTGELSSLNGTTGFTLKGEQSNDRSGWTVSSASDVNGDGISDFLVGAPFADSAGGADAGKTYLVFGKVGMGSGGTVELSSLNGTEGFTLNGAKAYDQSGVSVSTVGDVNGDSVSDYLIGAHYADPAEGREDAGKTYVLFGRAGLGAIELSNLDGTTGFTLNGDRTGDNSGFSVSSAGDVNGDGVPDLIIGAHRASPTSGRARAGKAYVVFGRKSASISSASRKTSSLSKSQLASLPRESTMLPQISGQEATHSIASKRVDRPPELSTGTLFTNFSKSSPKSLVSLTLTPGENTYTPLESSVLPLSIAGGMCAVISSLTAMILVSCRRKRAAPAERELDAKGAAMASDPDYAHGDLLLEGSSFHSVGDASGSLQEGLKHACEYGQISWGDLPYEYGDGVRDTLGTQSTVYSGVSAGSSSGETS